MLRLQDMFQNGQLALFLGFEGFRVVQYFPVTVSEDVGGKPAVESDKPGLEPGSQDCFHERLAGFKIFPAYRHIAVPGQLRQGRDIG